MTANDSQRLVNVINELVAGGTENGASLDFQEGFVSNGSSYLISAYMNGDEDSVVDGIIPLAGFYVGAGDYIQTVTDKFGFAAINRIYDTTLFSPVMFDPVRGRVLIGNGSNMPTNAGSYGYGLMSGGSGASMYWGPPQDLTVYQARSEKNALNGYVGRSAAGFIAGAYLGSAYSGAGTRYLADDGTWKTLPVFSGCKSVFSGTQSISDSTDTAVAWSTESYDTDSYHSTSSNTSRFTAPSTGYYSVKCGLEFAASNTTGFRNLWFKVNGTDVAPRDRRAPAGGTTSDLLIITADLELTSGDYVEAYVRQNSGGSVDVTGANSYTFFTIHAIH